MTKRIAVALLLVGCATDDISPYELQGGYGGASGPEAAQHVAGAAIATGGNVRAAAQPIASGGAVATGGTSTTGGASTGGGATGGAVATGGVVAIATGGTTSTGGTVAAAGSLAQPECRFLSAQSGKLVDLGPCSVYSKGRSHCVNGQCTPSEDEAYLDCDHDGVPETFARQDPNCGECGRNCGDLGEPTYTCKYPFYDAFTTGPMWSYCGFN